MLLPMMSALCDDVNDDAALKFLLHPSLHYVRALLNFQFEQ